MGKIINKKPTVLVVDNDEDMLVLVQHTLLQEGYDPIFSPNGRNIMTIIKERNPDVVLLDINMDGLDGAQLCREIKANPATSAVPIIMYSGNVDIEIVTRQCGADAFLAKPFETGKLKQVLKDLLIKRLL